MLAVKLLVASFVISAFAAAASAQPIQTQPQTPPVTLSCDELVRLVDDPSALQKATNSSATRAFGWRLVLIKLATIDGQDRIVDETLTPRLEARRGVQPHIGGLVRIEYEARTYNPKVNLPARYIVRWVSSRPVVFNGQLSRCSPESIRKTEISHTDPFAIRTDDVSNAPADYTLILQDGRRNILLTAVISFGQPAATASDPDEHAAVLRAAYKSQMVLDRCNSLNVAGASPSANRDRISRMEQSAAAIGINVRAAKLTAQQESKSGMEMFDMFELMGSMNYQQRDSLRQFCALQGLELLGASKHFTELDRAAGR
jgi:hypothetical protein